ncbi:uncharacterized protein VTP21DRAFT_11167 [Calcarisporiella thermophila]|uniref:uncharacterized protein n=1 Tax=Calcarisporiella thermophila TaxID=911321 RepID=UPI003744A325
MVTEHIKVSQLYIYPIKSCRGVPQTSLTINQYGFKYDRQWAIITSDMNKLSQRESPRMVLITPNIHEDPNHPTGGTLTLTAPGMEELELPLVPTQAIVQRKVVVQVWADKVDAYDMGDAAAEWLSRFLGKEVRLVHKSLEGIRKVEHHTPSEQELGFQAQSAFQDYFPMLLISEASLEDLNSRLETPVHILHFRPNVVVSGCSPFSEDTWLSFTIGGVEYHVACRCTRCTIPNVNHETGEPHPKHQPQRTLQGYRRVDKGAPYTACFGMNCVMKTTSGSVSIGDELTVLATGEHLRKIK